MHPTQAEQCEAQSARPRSMFHVKLSTDSPTDRRPGRPSMLMFHVKRARVALMLALAVAVLGVGCTGIQEPEGWAAPVDVDGRILVQSSRGQLSLVDRDTGSVAWRYPVESNGDAPFYATPVVDGAHIYIASLEGRVSRLQSGANAPTEDWVLTLEDRVVASPILNGSELYVPTERGSIVVIDADSGRLTRTIATAERRIWGSPAANSSTVFIGDLDNRVTAAFDIGTGDLRWEQALSGATAADLTLDGDLLLVGSFDQSLHALDISQGGDERWAYRGTGWFMAAPVVDGDVIFAVTMKGGVYALDRTTGTAIWTQEIDGAEFRASPVLLNGQLIAVARDGNVYALSADSGETVWSQRVTEDGNVNADVLVDGTEMYLVTSKQRLIRVDLARSGAFQAVPLTANQ